MKTIRHNVEYNGEAVKYVLTNAFGVQVFWREDNTQEKLRWLLEAEWEYSEDRPTCYGQIEQWRGHHVWKAAVATEGSMGAWAIVDLSDSQQRFVWMTKRVVVERLLKLGLLTWTKATDR